MISNIVYKVLKADTELATLLGATSDNSRIYPNAANPITLPCIIYYADAPTALNSEPYFYQQNITFDIYTKTIVQKTAICGRIYDILQKYDFFFNSDAMEDTGVIIREAHAVPSQVINNFPHETEQGVEAVLSFDFSFTKCAN